MSTKNFNETLIPQNYATMQRGKGFEVPEEGAEWLLKTYVKAFTEFLAITKNTTHPTAVAVSDLKGNLIVAAVVEFNAADDESEDAAGNWNYYWTWSKDDIPEGTEVIQLTEERVGRVVADVGFNLCRMAFNSPMYISGQAIDLFSMVKDTLDQNAPASGDDNTWTIECDGYIQATVQVENGEKAFSILPIGEMKSAIKKNDVATVKE